MDFPENMTLFLGPEQISERKGKGCVQLMQKTGLLGSKIGPDLIFVLRGCCEMVFSCQHIKKLVSTNFIPTRPTFSKVETNNNIVM